MRPSLRLALPVVLLLFALLGAALKWSPETREFVANTIPAWITGISAKVSLTAHAPGITPKPSTTSAGAAASATDNHGRATLFNEDQRSLLASNDPAKIDHGVLRILTKCGDLTMTSDPVQTMRNYGYHADSVRGTPKGLDVGDADEKQKMAALMRHVENCKHLQGEPPISAQEMAAFRALPGMRRYGAIGRDLDFRNGFTSPAAQAALAQAVSAPMFGLLESVMMRHVDYSELEKAYPQDQGGALPFFARNLVMCKLGDDCGEGGLLADQLCWQSGICGENVEAAIMANLRARGLDTGALNAFVTRVHLGLQAGDTSIFLRQKKTGQ